MSRLRGDVRPGPFVLAVACIGAVVLIALELARGGAGHGETQLHDPCLPRPGASFVLRGLDAAACRAGESREELLLEAADSPLGGIAAAVPDLRTTIEKWLAAALEGRDAEADAANELERTIFRLLDDLFAAGGAGGSGGAGG